VRLFRSWTIKKKGESPMMKRGVGVLLALFLALPAAAFAGGYASPTPEDLLRKIDDLSAELERVKQQLKEVQAGQARPVPVDQAELNQIRQQLKEVQAKQEDQSDVVDEVSEGLTDLLTDGVGRFSVWGDYRFRLDSTRLHQPKYYNVNDLVAAQMAGQMPALTRAYNPDNDTVYTNRVRLNARVQASENLTFKARLAMYKLWGMDSDFTSAGQGIFPANLFTHSATYGIRPSDSRIYVDRAFVNWTNIADLPVWFSIGRRPTTHGAPTQLREGLDERDATPLGLGICYAFDGLTLGYQYSYPWTGRIRFCYGRGFDSGFKELGQDVKLDDVDFYGFVWDVIDDPGNDLLVILQAFRAADIFDFPDGRLWLADDSGTTPFGAQQISMTTQTNLGDMYEITGLVQHKFRGVDWFISGGSSIADPKARSKGLFPDGPASPAFDPFQGASILTNPGEDLDTHYGWSVYAGVRIPLEILNSKLGLEYNYGSKYWMPFNVAADDLYLDKLSARGHVAEVYWIWDLPETYLSRYANAFIRAGYQYFWFDYTGTGVWLGKPVKLDDLQDSPANAQLFGPVDRMDNFYMTFEVFF